VDVDADIMSDAAAHAIPTSGAAGDPGHEVPVVTAAQAIIQPMTVMMMIIMLKSSHSNVRCRTVILDQNYRSSGNIVQAAQAIISRDKDRVDKKMRTSRAAGPPILLTVRTRLGCQSAGVPYGSRVTAGPPVADDGLAVLAC
jgi:hypothetical protein